ncbi:MAG: hypothetical protein K5682_11480 [Lachnospiraceae bacterium]|nr:hypothetical protein [Lachnospiraceae bacterium]
MKQVRRNQIAPWVALSICFAVLLLLNIGFIENRIDSDMAAEMIFSKLIAEQGKILEPTGWFYSTEFRIIYTQLIMAPLFRICSDWATIRIITNVVTYILLLGSYFYMMEMTETEKNVRVWTACLLLLPFSDNMCLHMHMGNTYMFHVILIFFAVGLFLRLAATKEKRGSGLRFVLQMVTFLVLSLIMGMSGVRYLMSFFAPLLLTVFVLWYQSAGVKRLQELQTSEHKQFLNAFVETIIDPDTLRKICVSILGTFFALAGYVMNRSVLSKIYDFASYEGVDFVKIYEGIFMERLQDTIGSLIMLFGYIPDRSVMSARGIVSVFALLTLGTLTVLFFRTRKKYGKGQFMVVFLETAFLLSTFLLLFTKSTNVPRYYIPSVIFMVPVIAVYYSRECRIFERVAFLLLMILGFGVLTLKAEVSYATNSTNESRMKSIEWLKNQSYTFGYATYWNANITQELSNGQLVVANIMEPESLGFFKWSSEAAYYIPSGEDGGKVPEGKVFLLLSNEQVEKYSQAPAIRKGEKVYVDEAFTVYSFGSSGDLLQYQIK